MPYRVTNRAGEQVAIAQTYETATSSVWIPGDMVTFMPQDEYDEEMAREKPHSSEDDPA